ncbi:MAG TPA: DUF2330 domain-containing protein [Mycobacteriales bacterium]|jgi:hypothetical protein|nr:DUF2330 domain-containing protein [Mycobacteriales bacterium]
MALSAGPAAACGGLIGPNGAVNLSRTTTFAGYANGVEHYVTSFTFQGGSGAFGSITPLPGVPDKIQRGGDWTLQRLVQETTPVRRESFAADSRTAAAALSSAEVVMEAKVDALDIKILKGTGSEVGRWAKQHGFRLPPDAPEVLDFYAQRSAIFMAAAFDADTASVKGQNIGDGTPIHLTIPTDRPWVPLRILGLGKSPTERVDADVYLLTERRPVTLPAAISAERADRLAAPGLVREYDERASGQLLRDLHDDKSGDWVPLEGMWLTKIRVDSTAGALKYDLAIDASGAGAPSVQDAGFTLNGLPTPTLPGSDSADVRRALTILGAGLLAVGALAVVARSRSTA